MASHLPAPPERTPDIDDSFTSPTLNEDLWIAHYLPHWTTSERSAAGYDLDHEGLRLRIEADTPDWHVGDPLVRVSHVQTGEFSGPLGSNRGTHRHRDGLEVVSPWPTRLLWTPSTGRLDVTVSASTDSACVLAAWLVGTEHESELDAGEICIFEIDAEAIGTSTTQACSGVKAHGDPRMTTDMADVTVPVDASRPHTWTTIWGDGRTIIGCEGRVVRDIPQSPDYPLILMLDVWELGEPSVPSDYPKTARIHRVRGWTGAP